MFCNCNNRCSAFILFLNLLIVIHKITQQSHLSATSYFIVDVISKVHIWNFRRVGIIIINGGYLFNLRKVRRKCDDKFSINIF